MLKHKRGRVNERLTEGNNNIEETRSPRGIRSILLHPPLGDVAITEMQKINEINKGREEGNNESEEGEEEEVGARRQ